MVDAAASKAAVRKDVRVRVPPPVFKKVQLSRFDQLLPKGSDETSADTHFCTIVSYIDDSDVFRGF